MIEEPVSPAGSGARDGGAAEPLQPAPGRRRFGEIARALGYVTAEDMDYALELQRATRALGREAERVGMLLVGMGAMTPDQAFAVAEMLGDQKAG